MKTDREGHNGMYSILCSVHCSVDADPHITHPSTQTDVRKAYIIIDS